MVYYIIIGNFCESIEVHNYIYGYYERFALSFEIHYNMRSFFFSQKLLGSNFKAKNFSNFFKNNLSLNRKFNLLLSLKL